MVILSQFQTKTVRQSDGEAFKIALRSPRPFSPKTPTEAVRANDYRALQADPVLDL